MSDTIFGKIIRKEIPAQFIHEDEDCVVFNDINPQGPVHFLVVPKKPILDLKSVKLEDQKLMGHCLLVAAQVAREKGLDGSGYRVVTNIGSHGGQSVPHIHFHVIGGRVLQWPPG